MRARNAYLEVQVLTASPARLRLMLIQAGLRTAQKCLERWARPLPADVADGLGLLRQVLVQLARSLGHGENQVQRDLQRVYQYLFRAVAQAQLSGDAEQLRGVVQVLEVERATWESLAPREASRHSASTT